MCDNFRPIRDLDIVMKEHQYIKYELPENRVNDNIFNDKCNKTNTNRMNTDLYQYNTSVFQFQNIQRPEPQLNNPNSNIIDVSNNLTRNPKNSCY